ncbi:hypothetical protein DWG18_07470 [Lysobacter sp. TY2-98]|uniref:hypothetical protein n=1 Tax=Lysobacter sp. TY2-98 TaxID=2290922 RepID=UPI000E1FC747|nr:hypothetical protein [Lysobacter sp. TY2-98]AXK72136.1 hypothetical protein DWG18_07470 [Lysobacter sp. TY2-98]
MNADVQLNLALILFLPWYAILVGLYWFFPRQPRSLVRWTFDVVALVVTTLLSIMAMQWGYLNADPHAGAIWKQVLATSVCYGVFLASMTSAFFLRRSLIVRPHARRASETTPVTHFPEVAS